MKKLTIIVLLAVFSLPTFAAKAWVRDAKIERTLIEDGVFGDCMIALDKTIASAGLDCPSKFVSLSCDGTYVAKISAQRMFDAALMAFALDKPVNVRIDDGLKHNGYCVAYRLDVFK